MPPTQPPCAPSCCRTGSGLDEFKGRALSFRDWNGQLRQPIPVVHPRALVTLAPLDGFLHRVTELDTLGVDVPETACTAFAP